MLQNDPVISGGHKWRVQLLFNRLLLMVEQTKEQKKNSCSRPPPFFFHPIRRRFTDFDDFDEGSFYQFVRIPRV